MPIVHFINSKQKQTPGGMKCVLGYVGKEKKTVREDRKYVTGINCDPAHAYDEMMLTKKVHRKTGGRLYYHLVQSFPKGYEITPEKAHQIACEFAQRAFGQYECVVATHIDREHIHSHIVFNSVSFETGKKYHSDKENPLKLMNLSDEICWEFNEPTLADPETKLKKRKVPKMSDREHHCAEKGQSVKMQLLFAITDCMKEAKSKKQFCRMMKERYGITVKWKDNHKHITYVMPSRYSFRDRRLLDEKFLKEAMEYEFKIRARLLNGEEQALAAGGSAPSNLRTDHGAELAGADRSRTEQSRSAGQDNENIIEINDRGTDAEISGSVVGDSGTGSERLHGDTGADSIGHITSDDGFIVTGWEPERSVLLNAEAARRMLAERQAQIYENTNCVTIGALDIIDGVTNLASIIDGAPTDPEEMERYIDSIRASQNAGFLIGFAVEAIKLLSETLEEMKAGQVESEEEYEAVDMEVEESEVEMDMMM
ncbi:Relaxase/Mobilisation nuclease domain-containing protein [Ruminococcaceae bacterium FB2012]|nr:Relaxase/Mobilisation nuclease domain-containing protein [Ruminococcaceae bacterium FB2012]